MRRALTILITLSGTATVLGSPPIADAQVRALDSVRDSARGAGRRDAPAGAREGQSQDELAQAAARVREAWLAHDAAKIVVNSPQLVVQLPGADPSTAVGPGQAAALISDFLAAAREVELVLRAARETEPGRGYVELVRRYRVSGTQNVRAQSLYLGFRRGQGGWVLVELRAIGP